MENKNYMTLEELIQLGNTNYLKLLKKGNIEYLLKAIGTFPDQTVTNDILILTQNQKATCVKRMLDWNYYGRSINKDEKAIKIISHYIEKQDRDFIDKNGDAYTKGTEQLKSRIGYVFDISQTNGKDYRYKIEKENLIKYFAEIVIALSTMVKDYEIVYQEQEKLYDIDEESKKLLLKEDVDIEEQLKATIFCITDILLNNKRKEGLLISDKFNIDEIEKSAANFAIAFRLNLQNPKCSFDEIKNFSDIELIKFKNNLQKVRSVVKQVTSKVELAVENAIKHQEKQIDKKQENEM